MKLFYLVNNIILNNFYKIKELYQSIKTYIILGTVLYLYFFNIF
nr:MAG TPA_asm: hypothetical protein [Caudoviricetes sp.]DAL50796.1 MAG TPA_asm: hypothetical protein [Caudoviricetes sp.]